MACDKSAKPAPGIDGGTDAIATVAPDEPVPPGNMEADVKAGMEAAPDVARLPDNMDAGLEAVLAEGMPGGNVLCVAEHRWVSPGWGADSGRKGGDSKAAWVAGMVLVMR